MGSLSMQQIFVLFHARRFCRVFLSCCLWLLFLNAAIPASWGQSLADRVLLVYNVNSPDSQGVAAHYATQRGVPPVNICGISPSSGSSISLAEYEASVKVSVQACLNAVNPQHILYIVLAYDTPYLIERADGPYSLDSYLSDVWDRYPSNQVLVGPQRTHGYYADSQAQGNVYRTFMSFATYRRTTETDLIYSVWRLDGATPALAMGLVDKAIAAEQAGGPAGNACFDRNIGDLANTPDWSYASGDWDLHKAAEFTVQAGLPVIEDANQAEFGTPPAPYCPGAALYSGWYSLNNYNDAFTWNAGSIGFHLDSYSAGNPRLGPNWSAEALVRGIAVTSGAVNEPFLQGLARPGGVYRNLLEGANVGDAFFRNTRWIKWMILNIGDPLYRPYPGGLAPFDRLITAESSFALQPKYVIGGSDTSTGVIRLKSPAPLGGVTLTLTSSAPELVSVPSSITVAPGRLTASFPIATAAVSGSTPIVITAVAEGILLQNTLEVYPNAGRSARIEAVSDGRMRPTTLAERKFGPISNKN